MARTKAVAVLGEIAKDLKPKDLLGLKGHGGEPKVLEQPADAKRSSILGNAFNWYNYFCTNKEAKQFIVDYLIANGDTTRAKKLAKVPDSKVRATYGWIARLSVRGLILSDDEKTRINTEIERVFLLNEDTNEEIEDAVQPDINKKNIQDVMKERATEAAGEIEGLFDDYISNGCKGLIESNKVINLLSEKKILPQHVSIVLEPWNRYKIEFEEVLNSDDEQLLEGYSHLSKTQIKNILKTVEQTSKDINSYANLKKVNKAKRVRKPVSVEKQVSKLKYLRKFVDDKLKLNLVSVEPTKLHNSSEAWVYDTAKRKLYHFVADDLNKSLYVKGNTLIGFDTKESEAKILRKPNEQIKQVMGSKPAARKFFKDIKAVATTPNGRFNANMIILKAF